MTSGHDQTSLRARLEEILGPERATTLWSMLEDRDDLTTKNDLTSTRDELMGEIALVREELKGEMSELRSDIKGELSEFRSEMKDEMSELRSEMKGDMSVLRSEMRGEMSELRSELGSFIRTFIRVQAATVVGVAGIVFAIVRLT